MGKWNWMCKHWWWNCAILCKCTIMYWKCECASICDRISQLWKRGHWKCECASMCGGNVQLCKHVQACGIELCKGGHWCGEPTARSISVSSSRTRHNFIPSNVCNSNSIGSGQELSKWYIYRQKSNWQKGTSCFLTVSLFSCQKGNYSPTKRQPSKYRLFCWSLESLACYIVLDWVKITLTILQLQLSIEHSSWVVSLASVQLWAILKQSAKNLNKIF